MALTVKHLNDDASFLLSFGPAVPDPQTGFKPESFKILIDPWISGPSTIVHPKMSVTYQRHQACISSLAELPEPDLLIISQHMPDHCNEATLRQLPATGTKTIILAEPASARLIRSWKHFDKDKVQEIPKWDDSTATKGACVVRIPVRPFFDGGELGEVTVAFIPQQKDMIGLHSAVGITYRPSTTSATAFPASDKKPPTEAASILTPPPSPRPRKSYTDLRRLFSPAGKGTPTDGLSPPTPTSPGLFSLRSMRSASSIRTTNTAATSVTTRSTPATPRPALSVLFSPHGITYASLDRYAKTHLAAESALPLTALLHCFDNISNPWWLGGEILLGAPVGIVTAARLDARVWISAHDGDKDVRGLANGLLKTRKWAPGEVVRKLEAQVELERFDRLVEDREPDGGAEMMGGVRGGKATEVVRLGIGEDVVLDRDGVYRPVQMESSANDLPAGTDADGIYMLPSPPVDAIWSADKGVPLVTEASVVVTPP